MKNTCIVIPSHERQVYLRRCVAYYENFDCRVVICDSSAIAYLENLPQNISYHHLPEKSFAEKILFALSIVAEDLVALAPDDDFLFEGALIKGAEILRKNLRLQACVGDVLAFPDKPPVHVIARCSGRGANAISSSAEINIRTYLANYHQVLWALFRRDILNLCFEIIEQAKFENENFFELTIAAVCAGKGGINYLDDYWILREVTQLEHWGGKHLAITKTSLNSMQSDVIRYHKFIDDSLFLGAADLALSAYLSIGDKSSEKSSLINSIKSFIARGISKLKKRNSGCVDWVNDPRFVMIKKVIAL